MATERKSPQNIFSLHESRPYPTLSSHRIVSSRMNLVSELSSSSLNKHVYGSNYYGHIFLNQGFPVFGEQIVKVTDPINVYNMATGEIEEAELKTIDNSSSVNTIRIKAGESRKKIELVNNNYSDISNLEYGISGVINTDSVHTSPLGLDFNYSVANRMWWEDTDNDFGYAKYYIGDGEDKTWYYSHNYFYGNDRPVLYDTRVNLYSGTTMYQNAFGLKAYVKIYLNTPLYFQKEIYAQKFVTKDYYNNGVYAVYDLDFVSTFNELKDETNPHLAILKYKSSVLGEREHNPSATDKLVLHLGDFYEKAEVWDPIIGKKVKLLDLDIDIVITVEDHTSRLQPDIVGITMYSEDAILPETLDYLAKSNIPQFNLLQGFDPSSFAYFSKGVQNPFKPFTQGDDEISPDSNKFYTFPLAGSQKITGVWPLTAPFGVSRVAKKIESWYGDSNESYLHMGTEFDTSNASYSIIPPPFTSSVSGNLFNGTATGFHKATEGGSGTWTFIFNLDNPVHPLDDEDYNIARNTFICTVIYERLYPTYYFYFSDDSGLYGLKNVATKAFTCFNPFEDQLTASDDVWFMSPQDMLKYTKGNAPEDFWAGSLRRNATYGTEALVTGDYPTDYDYSDVNHSMQYVLGWGHHSIDEMPSTNFASAGEKYFLYRDNQACLPQDNYINFARTDAPQRTPFTTQISGGGRDSEIHPSNATPAYWKQYIHPSNTLPEYSNRVFNQNTSGGDEDNLELISYTVYNETHYDDNSSAIETGTTPLTEAFLPFEDIMWAYNWDSSNVISANLDRENRCVKVTIDLSQDDGVDAWPNGDYSNLITFRDAISEGDILQFAKWPILVPVYFKPDLNFFPDFYKIIFELHDPDYIEIVDTFVKGNWTIANTSPRAVKDKWKLLLPEIENDIPAKKIYPLIFGEEWTEEDSIANFLDPNYTMYHTSAFYSKPNLVWFFILWQLYLKRFYNESIYSRISDELKIAQSTPTGVTPYYNSRNGKDRQWDRVSQDWDTSWSSDSPNSMPYFIPSNLGEVADSVFDAYWSYAYWNSWADGGRPSNVGFFTLFMRSMDGVEEFLGRYYEWAYLARAGTPVNLYETYGDNPMKKLYPFWEDSEYSNLSDWNFMDYTDEWQ